MLLGLGTGVRCMYVFSPLVPKRAICGLGHKYRMDRRTHHIHNKQIYDYEIYKNQRITKRSICSISKGKTHPNIHLCHVMLTQVRLQIEGPSNIDPHSPTVAVDNHLWIKIWSTPFPHHC